MAQRHAERTRQTHGHCAVHAEGRGAVRLPGYELRVKRAERHVDGGDARRTRDCDGAGRLGNDG